MGRDSYTQQQYDAIKKNSDLIVLGILWLISFTTIFAALLTDFIVPVKSYIGIGGLAALTVLRIIRRKNFKIVLAVFLFLGCIGLIQFSIITSHMYWGKSDDPSLRFYYGKLSIILLLLLIASNVNSISNMHKDPDGTVAAPDPKSIAYLDKYYDELKEKDDAYLLNILATRERWQKEYLEAAAKLIEERKS